MKKLISRFTMRHIGFNFTDAVSGKNVHNYVDKYGVQYLANYPFYPWGFRVKK